MEAEWIINGQTLHYGSNPVSVETDSILDTIFYKQTGNSRTDTIICNINKPGTYTFIYNECCGAFNIADNSGRFTIGSVIFKLKEPDTRSFLGTMGETGLLVYATTQDTLRTACRSAMSPNIYELTFSEIAICKDTVACNQGTCLYEKGQLELNYAFTYKTISTKLNCLFLALSDLPITVIYDPKTDEITIE